MISNIIDSNGFLVYTGSESSPKFATVLARAGHSRVDKSPDIEIAFTSKHKWNGTAWVEEPISGMPKWERDMQQSDSTMMPRWMEVHIEQEHNGVVADATLQQKYNDKKALRAGRPA